MAKSSADKSLCVWISQKDAFTRFAAHTGGTESARHIKPLHWYIACRLVLEGGFDPDHITPRPPFRVERIKAKRLNGRNVPARCVLIHDPAAGGTGEQVILGGLKTKNVDVVVTNPRLGPVVAVSCKGTTKSFRNLTNRMEETIGECTNLHITYPAMVIGYYSLLRANRTLEDALAAPDAEDLAEGTDKAGDLEEIIDGEGLPGAESSEASAAIPAAAEPAPISIEPDPATSVPTSAGVISAKVVELIKDNDIAIIPGPEGETATGGIKRFHAALSEMTSRLGIRDEISRYEAIAIALVEPKGSEVGEVFSNFPPPGSALHHEQFFATLYKRYEERFVYGAPLLAERGITTRFHWDPASPAFEGVDLGFDPRLAGA